MKPASPFSPPVFRVPPDHNKHIHGSEYIPATLPQGARTGLRRLRVDSGYAFSDPLGGDPDTKKTNQWASLRLWSGFEMAWAVDLPQNAGAKKRS